MELVKQIREAWRSETEVSEVEINNMLLELLTGGEKKKVWGRQGHTTETGPMVDLPSGS